MGVNLRELTPKTQISLMDLTGKSIAIDAYNAIYQFLAIIRQPNGTPLKDKMNRVTSHLSGLFYRTSNLVEAGIKVAYIFDGPPPVIKKTEIRRRINAKKRALVNYEQAIAEGRTEEAFKYAQATSRLNDYMEQDSKQLLTLMGIPWVQAPSEGEAQAAHMTKQGITDFCASQDYDSILFGTPSLIRNMTLSGRRKLPGKPVYIDVVPEVIMLDELLSKLAITYEQLVDIGILVGTDYNPGVKGIGPKKALGLIKEHGSIERLRETSLIDVEFPAEPSIIRNIFTHPKVKDGCKINWGLPNHDGIVEFLCEQHDFTESRVRRTLERMDKGLDEVKKRATLDQWLDTS